MTAGLPVNSGICQIPDQMKGWYGDDYDDDAGNVWIKIILIVMDSVGQFSWTFVFVDSIMNNQNDNIVTQLSCDS